MVTSSSFIVDLTSGTYHNVITSCIIQWRLVKTSLYKGESKWRSITLHCMNGMTKYTNRNGMTKYANSVTGVEWQNIPTAFFGWFVDLWYSLWKIDVLKWWKHGHKRCHFDYMWNQLFNINMAGLCGISTYILCHKPNCCFLSVKSKPTWLQLEKLKSSV